MKLRHGAMVAAGFLALAIGAVASVEIPNVWNPADAAFLKPALPRSGEVDGAGIAAATASVTELDQRSDDGLKEQLQKALDEDWGLHKTDIVVESVTRGVVALSGEAATISHHIRAVELVANFSGVQSVRSRVQVPGGLSGVDIWQDARETSGRGAYGNAWITVPIKSRSKDDATGQE